MEREKKIELLKSIQDGTRTKQEVIEILKGNRVEADAFSDVLKFTSGPENMEGVEVVFTDKLNKIFDEILNTKPDGNYDFK